jgi:hypothetical protein
MSLKTYALTTVSRVESFLGLTFNATEDSIMESIINMVTEYVERYTGRRFKQTAYTNEKYHGYGNDKILLKNFPVSTTATFDLDFHTTPENEDEWDDVDSEDYYIDYDAGIVYPTWGGDFRKERFYYSIDYTAGFDFNNTTTFLSDTTAGDLEFAVWKLCAAAWNRRRGDPGVESERIGDYAVTYGQVAMFEDPDIKAILDKYKRDEVFGVISPINT